MHKTKKHFSLLIISAFFVTIFTMLYSNVNAESIKDEEEIDWSEPITVKVKNKVDIDTFTVEYQGYEFNISLFGIDVVKSLDKENQKQKDFDNEYYTRLLRSNTVSIELDSLKNKYNKNNEIQVWIWTDNTLFQSKLVSEGLALLDKGIYKYSDCNKYCSILKNNESNAKKSLTGLWGADKYDLNYNVGGQKMDNLNLLIIASSILGILIIAIITVILIKKSKKKKNNTIKEVNKTVNKIENNTIDNTAEEITRVSNTEVKDEKEVTITRVSNEGTEKNQEESKNIIKNNILPELKNIDALNKTMLLNIISTQFNTKDTRFKEVPETIKLEMVLVSDNDELTSEKFSWFVKPMKYPKLTKYCKERCDVTQINVNDGILFEDLIENILPLMKRCDSIYSWGKSVLLQLQKEASEKLMPDKYDELIKVLNNKYINYKEDFAARNEITPCSLIKAADLADQVKEKDAVDTMLNIYKLERM